MKWRKMSEAVPEDGIIAVKHDNATIDHALSWLPVIVKQNGEKALVQGLKVKDGELFGAYGFKQSIADYAKEHPGAKFVQVRML